MAKSNLFLLKNYLIQRRLSFILIVFFIFSLFYAFILKTNNFSTYCFVYESALFFLLHALFAVVLNRIHAFYHSRSAITIVHLSTLFVFVLFYLFVNLEYANLFYFSDSKYMVFIQKSLLIKGFFSFLFLLAVVNQFWIDKHLIELEKKNNLFIENEKKLIQVELSHLHQQYQPHFLFNSLNSITALVGTEPKEARRMILLLSDFLRLSIRKKDNNFEIVEDEIDYLKLYLEIEKIRFADRLNVIFDIDSSLEKQKIPSQLLQPLLENAIKFGLYGNIGEITIKIEIKSMHDYIEILFENPFNINDSIRKQGTGFGLSSIQQKLAFLYKRNDLMHIEKHSNLFTIKVKIPSK